MLPSIVDSKGDCDGIPNVISEAVALLRLSVVSACRYGIPEVIQPGLDGVLIAMGENTAPADAIGRLLDHPDERCRLGQHARNTGIEQFDIGRNIDRLMGYFDAPPPVCIPSESAAPRWR